MGPRVKKIIYVYIGCFQIYRGKKCKRVGKILLSTLLLLFPQCIYLKKNTPVFKGMSCDDIFSFFPKIFVESVIIYSEQYGKMEDFVESDKMIEISGKVDLRRV